MTTCVDAVTVAQCLRPPWPMFSRPRALVRIPHEADAG
ncbi:hypothetical protein FHX78_11351 [Streptomyces capillispiralis]|uniref:Uncharacterized protein n=1 Tax=Streptomyces capillispiralis TaxID=68182 RepID=A0A561T8J9_9ACTN|nr:hypothetical protein FHX78_11351 [Streptomyces capillispiralis]